MNRFHALMECRRRWGSDGGVWEKDGFKQVGKKGMVMVTRWAMRPVRRERMTWIAGQGRTWEEAFAAADAKEGVKS